MLCRDKNGITKALLYDSKPDYVVPSKAHHMRATQYRKLVVERRTSSACKWSTQNWRNYADCELPQRTA